jgi:16S rRNA (guanine1207-N2)-methyltransferase
MERARPGGSRPFSIRRSNATLSRYRVAFALLEPALVRKSTKMSRDALRTLFHPFMSGRLPSPGRDERFLFIGAEPGFRLPSDFLAGLELVQGFRPYYLQLLAAGHHAGPSARGCGLDGALVLCGRHRGENETRIAEALRRVRPGGLIVVAGSTEEGVSSLRRRLEAVLRLEGHLPKYHGLVLWLRRPPDAGSAAEALQAVSTGVESRFVTAPGMFSHERIDPGSRLLAENLPASCRGAAADFGAGWGFLAAVLAERTAGLDWIDLYEADYASLEAARKNLAGMPDGPELGYFWLDLTAEKPDRKYDLVVMNPPFHRARAAEPGLGKAMILAASSALRPGGRLIMVHNRGLPYERTLGAAFAEVTEVAADEAFRVIAARH